MPKNPKIKLDVFADPKKEKKRLVAKPIIIKEVKVAVPRSESVPLISGLLGEKKAAFSTVRFALIAQWLTGFVLSRVKKSGVW